MKKLEKRVSRSGRLIAVLFALAAAFPGVRGEAIPDVSWNDSIPGAMEAAAAERKPVIVDVWAIWCAPCKLMDERTWHDPEIIQAAGRFIPLKVDSDANEVFVTRYDADVLPATLFLDGEGRVITRLTGYTDQAHLLRVMRTVLDGYETYLAAMAADPGPAGLADLSDYYLAVGNPAKAADLLKRAIKKDRGAAPEVSEQRELKLAEALLQDGRPDPAVKCASRIVEKSAVPAHRKRALELLVNAEKARGKESRSAAALERLNREFPGGSGKPVSE